MDLEEKKVNNKWCVISAVGENSLHRNWIKSNPKFDLYLITYDNSYDIFKNDTRYIFKSKGYKFKLIYAYVINNMDVFDKYGYFYMPDDDIAIDTDNIHYLFNFMKEYNLEIGQPAISINSPFSYPHTLRKSNSILRYTNFVEIMQPCFSSEALKKVLFTFNENTSGWGIDFHWGKIIDYRKYNMAIIDAIASEHCRPVQSDHHSELNEYLRKYNLPREVKECKWEN